MDQNITNEELLADMRTLNQEHVPNGYPCVQTWQIDRLIEMIDFRDEELDSVHDVLSQYVKEGITRAEQADTVALDIVRGWEGKTFICQSQARANLQVAIAQAIRGAI